MDENARRLGLAANGGTDIEMLTARIVTALCSDDALTQALADDEAASRDGLLTALAETDGDEDNDNENGDSEMGGDGHMNSNPEETPVTPHTGRAASDITKMRVAQHCGY